MVREKGPNEEMEKLYSSYERGIKDRMRKISKHARGNVLDIGYSSKPNPYLKDAFGLDVVMPKIKPANYKKLVIVDAKDPYKYPFKDGFFDCVIASEVIEHIPDLSPFLNEVHRVLKKGGVFAVSTPNPESPVEVLVHIGHAIKGHDFRLGRAGDHVHEFPSTNMISLLNIYGFRPFKIMGTYFQIPFSAIQVPWNNVPLTYCTIYFARKR